MITPVDKNKVIELIDASTSFILLVKAEGHVRSLCSGEFRREIIEHFWGTPPKPVKKAEQ
jgi:hypothetical protein